jgi:hypothetical protein
MSLRGRVTSSQWTLVAVALAVLFAVLLLFSKGGAESDAGRSAESSFAADPTAQLPTRTAVDYGDEMTLDEAIRDSKIPLVLPAAEEANSDNLVGVFAGPGQTFSFVFPIATETTEGIRNPEVVVIESPWEYEAEASDHYEADLERNPAEGKELCTVRELDAICIDARSKSDEEQANAAYVGLRVGDLEVQVTGGDSLDVAQRVAESIVENSATAG